MATVDGKADPTGQNVFTEPQGFGVTVPFGQKCPAVQVMHDADEEDPLLGLYVPAPHSVCKRHKGLKKTLCKWVRSAGREGRKWSPTGQGKKEATVTHHHDRAGGTECPRVTGLGASHGAASLRT